jgi:hypothetical protein
LQAIVSGIDATKSPMFSPSVNFPSILAPRKLDRAVLRRELVSQRSEFA